MSRINDLVRCLQGAQIVSKHWVRIQGGEVSEVASTAARHVQDIAAKLSLDTGGGDQLSNPYPSQNKNEHGDWVPSTTLHHSDDADTSTKISSEKKKSGNNASSSASTLSLELENVDQSVTRSSHAPGKQGSGDSRADVSTIASGSGELPSQEPSVEQVTSSPPPSAPKREAKGVPSSPFQRAFGFGVLGAQLAMSASRQAVANAFSSPAEPQTQLSTGEIPSEKSKPKRKMLTDKGYQQFVETLRTMRGAALKIGQWMSLQEESMLPEPLAKALQSVHSTAHHMPSEQLKGQLEQEYGKDWRETVFVDFPEEPIAAASIGQVHHARLASTHATETEGILDVAVKVQYPGVANSIDSDLRNLQMITRFGGFLPPGLFVDNIIRVGRQELQAECDYRQEAAFQERYRCLVDSDSALRCTFQVPRVFPDLSTRHVLVSEWMEGTRPIEEAFRLPQNARDRLGEQLLRLTLREVFTWRLIQSDPNFGNYLLRVRASTTDDDVSSGRVVAPPTTEELDNTNSIVLLDFGATREYPEGFVELYGDIVLGAASRDEDRILEASYALGFLTGDESARMVRAHVDGALVMGQPFAGDDNAGDDDKFDFKDSDIMMRLRDHASVFATDRLTPPPNEAYSLQRKLAGVYMTCIRLGARVDARALLEEVLGNVESTTQT